MVVNRSEGITSMDIFITINLPEKVKLVYYKCIRLAIGDVLPIKKILILRCIKVTDVIIFGSCTIVFETVHFLKYLRLFP